MQIFTLRNFVAVSIIVFAGFAGYYGADAINKLFKPKLVMLPYVSESCDDMGNCEGRFQTTARFDADDYGFDYFADDWSADWGTDYYDASYADEVDAELPPI